MAEQGPNIAGLFGVILNNVLAQQDRPNWQGLPRFERDCLAAHNTSPAILAYHNIGISDPEVQKAFVECARNATSEVAASLTNSTQTRLTNSDFKVDGLTLGGRLAPNAVAYQAYRCHASDDFPGFQWCGLQRKVNGVVRPYEETMTVFLTPDYNVAFVLQEVAPAYFAPGDPQREIQRLSKNFGQSAHVMTGPRSFEAANSIIVTWGDVTLTPLDAANVETLRQGHVIHAGLIMDFLGDAKASAREGMPLYRIGGGAGYIWNATYDDNGKGRLRVAAVNTNQIGPSPDQVTDIAPAQPRTLVPGVIPTPAQTATQDSNKTDSDGDGARTAAAPNSAGPAGIPTPALAATPNPKKSESRDDGVGSPNASAYAPPLIPAATPSTVQTAPATPEMVEADRAARVEHATTAATIQIKDAEAFIQENPNSPELLGYVKALNALSVAVTTADPDNIAHRSIELSAALSHDPKYRQHLTAVAAAQTKQSALFLGDALIHGEQQRAFIMEFIAKHPLSPATPGLAELVTQLVPLLKRNDLAPLQATVDKIDLTIREADLEDAFVASQRVQSNPAGGLLSSNDSLQLPVTEKNNFLMKGDLGDVVYLYNASPSAPHIARNLRGEYVFANDKANVCLFGQNPGDFGVRVKKRLSDQILAKSVEIIIVPTCDPNRLLDYDFVAAQRSALLRSPRSDALELIKAVENDDYRLFSNVTAEDVGKFLQSEHDEIERNKANVSDGEPGGFGIVLLKTGSPNLCVAAADDLDSHRELLLHASDRISLDMHSDVVLKNTSIDDAFADFQKHQCGAIYASAANLKMLTSALAGADASYSISSLWLLPEAIKQEEVVLANKKHVEELASTETAVRNADQARLAAVRAKDINATQEARQVALRTKFGDSGKAASATLSSEIIGWDNQQTALHATLGDRRNAAPASASTDVGPSGEKSQGWVGLAYPRYEAWLADKLADHWEITTTDSELSDFGTSVFKDRLLDTVFSKVTLHLKNRILGQYDSACFIFERINDVEFAVSREFIFAPCNDQAAVTEWQSGHEFKSEWIVTN